MAKGEQLNLESGVGAPAIEEDVQEQAEDRIEKREDHGRSWWQIYRAGIRAEGGGTERFLTAQADRPGTDDEP